MAEASSTEVHGHRRNSADGTASTRSLSPGRDSRASSIRSTGSTHSWFKKSNPAQSSTSKPRGHSRSGSAGAISLDSGRGGATTNVNGGQADLRTRLRTWKTNLDAFVTRLTRDNAQTHTLEFLRHLPSSARKDAASQIERFLNRFDKEMRNTTVEDQSSAVLRFYQMLEDRVTMSEAWQHVDDNMLAETLDNIECHIAQHIYESVFENITRSQTKDAQMQSRLFSLRWVEPNHLEAPLDISKPGVKEAISQAQDLLISMDAMQAPQDKLACVVSCSKKVFEALSASAKDSKTAAAADDFLPALIYVVIHANPPLLFANIQFVQQFCNPAKLHAGEGGYYFTNLVGACHFVENVGSDKLNLTEEEFQNFMKIDFGAEAISFMEECLQRLRVLENKQQHLQAHAQSLSETVQALYASSVKPVPSVPPESQARTDGYTTLMSEKN